MTIAIVRCTTENMRDWVRFRHVLWHEHTEEHLFAEVDMMLTRPDRYAGFLAVDDAAGPVGFAEVSIRHDSVSGCKTSPVAFLEGIYVAPEARRKGVAGLLVHAVEAWARQKGMTELGSDAYADNTVSHAMHRSLGFEDTERVVFFRKALE